MSGCACGCKKDGMGKESKQILEALAVAEKPYGSKDLVETTGLEKEIISKEVPKLKKKGFVDNPARCKYGITEQGRAAIS